MTPDEERNAAQDTVIRQGELSLTLTASEDEWPLDLRTVAKSMVHLDGLLRALSKEVSPETRLEPVLLRVDILRPKVSITVRVQPARKRPRPRRSKA